MGKTPRNISVSNARKDNLEEAEGIEDAQTYLVWPFGQGWRFDWQARGALGKLEVVEGGVAGVQVNQDDRKITIVQVRIQGEATLTGLQKTLRNMKCTIVEPFKGGAAIIIVEGIQSRRTTTKNAAPIHVIDMGRRALSTPRCPQKDTSHPWSHQAEGKAKPVEGPVCKMANGIMKASAKKLGVQTTFRIKTRRSEQ